MESVGAQLVSIEATPSTRWSGVVIPELLSTKTKSWRGPQPWAPLCVNVLIALSLVMLPVLREIPMAVLYGLFLYQAGPCNPSLNWHLFCPWNHWPFSLRGSQTVRGAKLKRETFPFQLKWQLFCP